MARISGKITVVVKYDPSRFHEEDYDERFELVSVKSESDGPLPDRVLSDTEWFREHANNVGLVSGAWSALAFEEDELPVVGAIDTVTGYMEWCKWSYESPDDGDEVFNMVSVEWKLL